jgi:hypothetical protein
MIGFFLTQYKPKIVDLKCHYSLIQSSYVHIQLKKFLNGTTKWNT